MASDKILKEKGLKIRQRRVRYGNPALGTYSGEVYTLHDVLDHGLCTYSNAAADKNDDDSCSSYEDEEYLSYEEYSEKILYGTGNNDDRLNTSNNINNNNLVCMVHVPPEQLPEGVLNLARAHRSLISHVRVVVSSPSSRSTGSKEKVAFDGEIAMDAFSAGAECHIRAKSQVIAKGHLSSIDERLGIFYIVLFDMRSERAVVDFVQDLNGRPYSSLEADVKCRAYRCIVSEGNQAYNDAGDEKGAVHVGCGMMDPFYTGGLGERSSSTGRNPLLDVGKPPVKNGLAGEVQNCAVCLERMEIENDNAMIAKAGTSPAEMARENSVSIITTVCNHTFHLDCLLQWRAAPCPVCRYDHSGSKQALSSCSVCGGTDRVYVCLICGVTSCSRRGHFDTTGVTRSNPTETNHALDHYNETLHTYAVEVETQHVWDFAGNGYVHRLLQNKDDGKLVEINDPHNTRSHERSLSPGLTERQEGEVVHRKLEGFASQYHLLLKHQLEQQRLYYEERINDIRREHEDKVKLISHSEMMGALKRERNRLDQRCAILRRKINKISTDANFHREMIQSLEGNRDPLLKQIEDMKRMFIEARVARLKRLPKLEERVAKLMSQLDQSNH